MILLRSARVRQKHEYSNRPLGGPARSSAKNQVKPINFYCDAPAARDLFIVGDFNDWNPTADPMEKQFGRNEMNEKVSLIAVS